MAVTLRGRVILSIQKQFIVREGVEGWSAECQGELDKIFLCEVSIDGRGRSIQMAFMDAITGDRKGTKMSNNANLDYIEYEFTVEGSIHKEGLTETMPDKPPPKCLRRIRKPEHRCYELAGLAVLEDAALILVHGTKPHRIADCIIPIDHAWIYDPADDTVFDTTDQRWYAASEYPGVERVRYTRYEAAFLRSPHWGPWDRPWDK
jgi:hypothetical protein